MRGQVGVNNIAAAEKSVPRTLVHSVRKRSGYLRCKKQPSSVVWQQSFQETKDLRDFAAHLFFAG